MTDENLCDFDLDYLVSGILQNGSIVHAVTSPAYTSTEPTPASEDVLSPSRETRSSPDAMGHIRRWLDSSPSDELSNCLKNVSVLGKSPASFLKRRYSSQRDHVDKKSYDRRTHREGRKSRNKEYLDSDFPELSSSSIVTSSAKRHLFDTQTPKKVSGPTLLPKRSRRLVRRRSSLVLPEDSENLRLALPASVSPEADTSIDVDPQKQSSSIPSTDPPRSSPILLSLNLASADSEARKHDDEEELIMAARDYFEVSDAPMEGLTDVESHKESILSSVEDNDIELSPKRMDREYSEPSNDYSPAQIFNREVEFERIQSRESSEVQRDDKQTFTKSISKNTNDPEAAPSDASSASVFPDKMDLAEPVEATDSSNDEQDIEVRDEASKEVAETEDLAAGPATDKIAKKLYAFNTEDLQSKERRSDIDNSVLWRQVLEDHKPSVLSTSSLASNEERSPKRHKSVDNNNMYSVILQRAELGEDLPALQEVEDRDDRQTSVSIYSSASDTSVPRTTPPLLSLMTNRKGSRALTQKL